MLEYLRMNTQKLKFSPFLILFLSHGLPSRRDTKLRAPDKELVMDV